MSEDWIESWEEYVELHERGDYEGLVAYCEAEVEQRPDDLHALERLGSAYVLNGNYEKAKQRMAKAHYQLPNIEDFQHVILDALFAQGKTESDIQWANRPVVLRLGKEVCDMCYEYLRPKRKPRYVFELHSELWIQGYLAFNEDELLQALQQDDRFLVVQEHECDFLVSVSRRASVKRRVRSVIG